MDINSSTEGEIEYLLAGEFRYKVFSECKFSLYAV